MKKLLSQIIAVVLCCIMGFAVLSGCNKTIPSNPATSSSSEQVTSSANSSSNSSSSKPSSSVTTSSSATSSSTTTSVTTSTPTSTATSSSSSLVTSSSANSSSNSSSSNTPIIPEEPNEVVVGNVRVQLLSDTLVRIENKGAKGFEDRNSYLVTNRDEWEKVSYEKIVGSSETVIITTSYSVHIPNGASAESAYITTVGNDKTLWKYNGLTDTNVYLPSPSDELKSWYFTDSPRIIPSETGWNNVNEVNQGWDFDNDATDVFVFLPNGNYETFTTDYIKLTGEAEMVDLQTLGYWDSRWYAYSAETALQQIQDYRDKGYAIDVLVIDTDWRDASNGVGYEINTSLFPNMAEFLAECERLGIDVAFNDHPEPVGGTSSGLDGAEIDYRSNNLTLILSMGLDYWWYDRNWHVSLNSVSPDISVYAFGMYAYQFVTQEYLESITKLGEYAERALIMANVDGCLHGKWNYASDLTAHRYSIQWTGDIGADSNALAQEIYASVFGGAEVGLPYMSSDIGGHNGKVTDDMYARWMQYGALSTLCRVHCTHKNYIGQDGRMPWLFGETAEEVSHTYLDMRYRLLPLYYYLSYRNYTTGLPIMSRTDINYSDYIEAQANDQYLLGDYVLVAPITTAGPSTKAPNAYLTHTDGGVSVAGLQAEYFNTSDWSGSAVKQIDKNVYFNWTTGGPAGFGADNYSIRWTGNITFGDYDASLSFYADDAVIVSIDGVTVIDGSNVYDTMLTTPVYKAGSTHTIEIKYAEFSGNAHIYMYYTEQGENANTNERDVFIPDGTWIDVWSGKRYTGPYTYTVHHPITTSPIFVREGSLIFLAKNATNTREQIWNDLTLDVYPSANFNASATLYEDDTNTVAYKDGKFRTTDVDMTYNTNNGALVITINPAEGTFSGTKSFTERTWNLRLHTNPGWGAITAVKVNGQTKTANLVAKSSTAKPFAFSGAALDGDIYTLSIENASIYTQIIIEVYYESVTNSIVNSNYDDTAINFTMSVENSGDKLDLESVGDIAWVSYGDVTAYDVITKQGVTNPFNMPSSYENMWTNYSTYFTKIYTKGGKDIASTGGISSHKNIDFTIDTVGREAYYVIYVSGTQSTAKVTVADRAGNKVTEFMGNIGGNYKQRIVIHVTDTVESKLYVTFAVHASETEKLSGTSTSATGTGSPSTITIMAGVVSSTLPGIFNYTVGSLTAGATSTDATGSACLSTYGQTYGEETLDWIQTGYDGGVTRVRRYGGNSISSLNFNVSQTFDDYAMNLSYFDGEELGAHTGTTKGLCSTSDISATILVNKDTKRIVLFTGAWRATNTVYVYDCIGTLLCSSAPFTAGGTAVAKIVTIDVNALESTTITIIIRPSAQEGDYGNVSLPAIAVTGTSQEKTSTVSLADCKDVSGTVNLTEVGTTDWIYLGSDAQKANATSITSPNAIIMGGNYAFSGYAANLSYTDGEDGSKSNLTAGENTDFARMEITVDEGYNYVDIYGAVTNAIAGIHVIDSNGSALGSYTPVTNSTATSKSFQVKLLIQAEKKETLTLIYYKGGNGVGSAALVAIALSNHTTPMFGITSTASISNIEGQNITINDSNTLYWEHYTDSGMDKMLNANDIISNSAESVTRGFYDYKASLNWTNGTNNLAYMNNINGLADGTEFTINVTINPSVSKILIYTGAWRATGTATLSFNGNVIATSESWTAGETGIARLVTFNVSTANSETVTIKVTPTAMGDAGNVSMVAVVVVGNNPITPTLSTSLSTTEMTDYNTNKYNLTEYGTTDWYYPNYEGNPDEKAEGTAIDTSSLKCDYKGLFWDYKAAFNWTDGTINSTSLIDTDCNNAGTNNGICASYVSIDVTVTSATQNVYLWVGGWQSTYYVQVIDENGNVLVNRLMHEATDTTYAYLCDFAINTTTTQKLNFSIYRTSATGNASLATIAVK